MPNAKHEQLDYKKIEILAEDFTIVPRDGSAPISLAEYVQDLEARIEQLETA